MSILARLGRRVDGSDDDRQQRYVELTPHERIRYTDKLDDPSLPGEMQVTIALRKVDCGNELKIVQEGLPPVIPVANCYLGWQESLSLLAHLVEAEIPE